MSSTSESRWWYLFHKEIKSWDSITWFKIWQFQTPAWKRYLQMHLLTERFFFVGDDWGFLQEGMKTYLMAPMSPLNSPTIFPSSHLYSMIYSKLEPFCLQTDLMRFFFFNALKYFVMFSSLFIQIFWWSLHRAESSTYLPPYTSLETYP